MAINQLGYRPNGNARALATHDNRLLGAIVPTLSELGPSRDVQGAIAGARTAGYVLDVLTVAPDDPEEFVNAVKFFESRDVAGLLVQASTDQLLAAASAYKFRVPTYIEHEDWRYRERMPSADTDGIALVIDHLIKLGHARFLFISGPYGWVSSRNRLNSYLASLASHDANSAGTVQGDWSARSGYEVIAALKPPLDFTAVVSANDQMALGAMLALSDRGLEVPTDVSVSGFDDLPDAGYYQPPLTTVAQDSASQGNLAVARLLQLIEGVEDSELRSEVVPGLVIRRSTGEARQS